jgi:uncharacterized protein YwqG
MLRNLAMSPTLARQLLKDARFEALSDLLAPSIAVRPRVLHAAPPRHKSGRWLDWLLKPSSPGPAIETVPVLDDFSLPIGASRFDSVPDVPIGFEWPCHSTGALMECLAQIDLAQLPSVGSASLPREGWLLFFVGDGGGLLDELESRVIHFEHQPLVRWATQVPRVLTRQTCRLDFESIHSLPDLNDWCMRQRMKFDESQIDSYIRLQEKLSNGAHHYLLGYPNPIQGDVRAEAVHQQSDASGAGLSWEECAKKGDGYTLLLQLDSDSDGPGWMWGDAGSIYFVIRKDDLEARRFDRVRLVMQCC